MKLHRYSRMSYTILLLGIVSLFVLPLPAEASTFVVNTYDDIDDGQCDTNHCSLREAINAANTNNGPDEIHFDLPGSGGSNTTIYLTSPLPALADDATTIDGTTEPDYAGLPVFGIQDGMPGIEVGLDLQSNDNIIRGLSLYGFGTMPAYAYFHYSDPTGSAILVTGSGNLIQENRIGSGGLLLNAVGVRIYGANNDIIRNVISGNGIGIYGDGPSTAIRGNVIGPDADGVTPVSNGFGIFLGTGAQSAYIGGIDSGEGNLISANYIIAIVSQSADNQIHGNLIGVDGTGTTALPNHEGISINGPNAWIGGSLPQHSNVISGNEQWGLAIDHGGDNAVIQGNKIGTDISGSVLIPNQWQGITSFADDVVIGGTLPGEGNMIRGNGGHGVIIADGASGNLVTNNTIADNGQHGIYLNSSIPIWGYLTQNTFTQNSIYNNGGLGINIMPGHNGNIQPPQITSPQDSTIEGTAWYSCKIEIFRADPDPSGFGEGKVFLAEGYTTETDDTFSIPISSPGYCFKVTATATDSDGNTSEFSQNATAKCFSKPPDIFLYPIWVFIIVVFAFIAWRIRRRRPGLPVWTIPFGGLIGGLLALAIFIALPFAEPEPPPNVPICGNGAVEGGELCDGDDLTRCLSGQVCENCQCITYMDLCGNGVVDSGEQCDGDDLTMCLEGQVCENCKCITMMGICGNGVVDNGEQCDGDDLTMCLEGQVCENCKCITYVEAEPEICVYKALQNTNCRASDYPESELVETLMEGDMVDLTALNPEYTHGLFELENGKKCWIWLGLMGGDENPFGNCPVEIVDPPGAPPVSACSSDLDERACIAAGGEWTEGMAAPYCACPE